MKKISLILAAAMIAALILGTCAEDINEYQRAKTAAHEAAEVMRSYGYPEDNPVIRAASAWWWEQDAAEQAATEGTETAEIIPIEPPAAETVTESDENAETWYTPEQLEQYPTACKVWAYLRDDMGLSAPVAAGIIGNMMAECGGQTLDLQPYIYSGGYYGLCMWYLAYTNGSLYWGSDVTDQLEYLRDTLETNYTLFGGDYAAFIALTDPADTAYYFEYYYERGQWSYIRATNAQAVMEYFGEA